MMIQFAIFHPTELPAIAVRCFMKILTIILYLLVFHSFALSQTGDYIYQQLTDADGLSQSTIFAAIQDKEGYLWLGTIDGLNRYDGYEFKVYMNNPTDTNSLSDNFISALFEDSEGYIWIGTVNGHLNRLNKKNEIIKRFYIKDYIEAEIKQEINFYEYPLAFSRNQINTVTTINEDKDGYLWIGTWGNGIIKFDKKNKRALHIFNESNHSQGLSSNRILDIIIDRNGTLWIATFGGGINKLDQKYLLNQKQNPELKPTFLHYRNDENVNTSIGDDKVINLFEDRDKNLWIGTYDAGLNKLDFINKNYPPVRAKFEQYLFTANSPGTLNNTVMAIEEDFEGYLWIGTFGSSVKRFDKNSKLFIDFSELSVQQTVFHDAEILSLFVDRSGIIWVGSHLGEGVTKIQKRDPKFKKINSQSMGRLKLNDDVVWALFKDSENNLWVGTYRGGVNVLNFESKQKYTLTSSEGANSISDNHIRSFAQDKFGNIWVGTYSGGLNRINRDNRKIDVYKNEPRNYESLSANQVLDILVESENEIWVATFGGGLNKLTFEDNTNGDPSFKIFKSNPSDPTSLSDDRVYTILKDSKGNFWVGTYGGGLNKFDEATGIFEVYRYDPDNPQSISNDKVMCILESSNKEIWIGTSGGGLNKFNPEAKSFKNFSLNQGLTSAVVYGILEDDNKNLWLSTDDGIFLFHPDAEKFTQFGIEDGVQSLEFSGGAYYKDEDGIMYFGGINGFNYFDPDSIKINPYIPPVVISSIKVMDEEVKGTPEELILSYDQNFISLEFSALDFSVPKRNRYRYILEGFQKTWIYTEGSKRTATYTNLPAGEFTFHVKGTNSDGIWNENAAKIKIIINPPFWQTWWFLTLIIMIVAFFIYYISTIRIKNQLEIEKLKLKIASDLHDNIGSGLTEISILSEVAERNKDNTNSAVKKDLRKISDTARLLVDSMSDIVWVVNPQRDSLHDLIVKLKDSYNEFFSSIGISFQVKNVEKSDDIKLPMEYKQNLLLMFKEAINNAIKHSSCKKIILEALYKDHTIEIMLKDDGIGFDSKIVNYGNGLRNMKNRADKLKGILKVNSEKGKGTSIIFSGKLSRLKTIGTKITG